MSESLNTQQSALFKEGLQCFNQAAYFDCHEFWEALWMQLKDPDKRFLQGLIQLSVACYHASNQNFKGASSLMQASYDKLTEATYSPWVDTQDLLPKIEVYLAELRQWQTRSPDHAYQQWQLDARPSVCP